MGRRRLTVWLAIAGFAAVLVAFAAFAVLSARIGGRLGDADEGGRRTPGGPVMRLAGTPRIVYDWSREACEPPDSPDLPVRAFRDRRGRVHLTFARYVNRQMVGRSLQSVRHSCAVTMRSSFATDPAAFNNREWLASPYTVDGRTVRALVHNEYHGIQGSARCPSGDYLECWYNAITLATSTDEGFAYRQLPPRRHLVAGPPDRYRPDAGPYGVFEPSNVVRNPRDGLYYALVRVADYGSQEQGSCLIRTGRLDRADSWRAWDGSGFRARLGDPYASPSRAGTCRPVSPTNIQSMVSSLTYNTHLDRWLLVGHTGDWSPRRRETVWGIYYSTSEDLLSWTRRKLMVEQELLWTYRCGDDDPVLYPALLDPRSRSRNFETTGRRAHLYYTRFNHRGCRLTEDRDLIRVPVEVRR